MAALGSRGRLNFFWELTAAGKGGAENMAATTLMRVIHDCICSRLLGRQHRARFLSSSASPSGGMVLFMTLFIQVSQARPKLAILSRMTLNF